MNELTKIEEILLWAIAELEDEAYGFKIRQHVSAKLGLEKPSDFIAKLGARWHKGRLVMHPAQALETWWDCTNPMPELAGCIAVSERLQALSQDPFYRQFRAKLPALPLRRVKAVHAPMRRFLSPRNDEVE